MKLVKLLSIQEPLPLSSLDEDALRELQTALGILGYPVGEIDGMIGPHTRTAWAEFKTDVFQGNPGLIGPGAIHVLETKLESIAKKGEYDFSTKEGTLAAIAAECVAQGIGLPAQIAYVMATVEWETAKTFKPVREAFWLGEEWRKERLRYYPYYGRGYVQLTWRNNYQRYSTLTGKDLVKNPDLALRPEIALFVLVHGFKTGTFTGRKIGDYIDSDRRNFVGARRCINGTDHDNDIAALALKYLMNL